MSLSALRSEGCLSIVTYSISSRHISRVSSCTSASLSAYAHSRHLLSDLNTKKTEIEDLQTKINVLRKYRKLKVYGDELKDLSGRQEKKYRNEHLYELSQYSDIREKVLEIYPSGRIPTVR